MKDLTRKLEKEINELRVTNAALSAKIELLESKHDDLKFSVSNMKTNAESIVNIQPQAVYPTISQVDGMEDLDESCDIKDKSNCPFCDEDFLKKEDISNHMKIHGFMCNNCCDYFHEKDGFSIHDYGWINSGIVLPQPP